MSSNAKVVFDADSGRFVSAVDGMDKAVAKASENVAKAKNTILQFGQQTVAAAKEAGASSERLASIQEATAKRLASVTESNATRVINSLDRQAAKAREVAAEMSNVNQVIDISTARASAFAEVQNRLKTSTVLRVAEGGTSIRGAEAFISAVPILSKLSNFVFPIASAVGFVAIIGEGVSKLKEMYDKAEQVPSAIAEGFAAINQPLTSTADTLQRDNDQLADAIAKLEHKPTNGLALALDDARINADKLADSATKATDAVVKLLNANSISRLNSLFTGQAQTGDLEAQLKKRFSDIAAASNEDQKRFRYDTSPLASAEQQKNALAEHNKRLDAIDKQRQDLQAYIRQQRAWVNGSHLYQGNWGRYYLPNVTGDKSAYNNLLNGSEDVLDSQQEIAGDMRLNPTLQGKKATLEGQKQAAADAKKAATDALDNIKHQFESLKNSLGYVAPEAALAYWQQFTHSSDAKIAETAKEQAHRYYAEFASALKEHNPLVEKFLKDQKDLANLRLPEQPRSDVFGNTKETSAQLTNAYSRERMEAILQDAQKQREQVQIALSQGRLSKSDADKQLGDITRNEHAARITDLQGQLAQFQKTATTWNPLTQMYGSNREQQQYVALMSQLAKEAGQAQIDAMKDAAQQSADTWQGSLNNAFDLWLQHATDTASQVKELFAHSVDGLNENLVNLMSGDYRRGDFKRYGHQAFKGIAGTALQQGEGHLLKVLGVAGKPDGSSSKPFYVRFANAVDGAAHGVSSAIGSAAGGVSGFFGKALGFAATLFGGGRAVGGGVNAGTTYLVGENGPELFSPQSNGTIVPNHALGGGNVYYHVEVANGVTPEQMNMHVRAALQEYHPHGVHAAVQAVHDHAKRVPSSSR